MLDLRPATLDDVDALVAVYAAYDTVEMGAPEVEAADVTALLSTEGSDSVVAEAGGRVVGFAQVGRSGEVETLVHPSYDDAVALQRALLARVLDEARRQGIRRVEHWAGARPDGAAVLLAEAGFAHARTTWRMRRALDGELPEPVWPAGVSVQPFDADCDARPVWELVMRGFAGSFGSHQRPFEEWSLHALGPDKGAVCAVEAGRLVAVATTGPRSGEGHVGQLTVDPEHRGRGLALALLHETFRRDAAAGLPATRLGVDGENAGARRLYDKAGMSVVGEFRRWERDL